MSSHRDEKIAWVSETEEQSKTKVIDLALAPEDLLTKGEPFGEQCLEFKG